MKQDLNENIMFPGSSKPKTESHLFSLIIPPFSHLAVMSAEAAPLPQSVTQPQPLTLLLPDSTLIFSCSRYTSSWSTV